MRAALAARDGVDLVDDHVLDLAEGLARAAGEHQVERFRRRDEDVRRAPRDLAAILLGRIAGPGGDRDVWLGLAEAGGRERNPGERCAEVALDVVGEGLERADVQDADVARVLAGGRRAGVSNEAVEGVEEGSQRLATPRRRVDQRVLATRDRRPALGLSLGRGLEARGEPLADGRAERRERIRAGERGHGTCQYRFLPPNRPDVLSRAATSVVASQTTVSSASTPSRVNNGPQGPAAVRWIRCRCHRHSPRDRSTSRRTGRLQRRWHVAAERTGGFVDRRRPFRESWMRRGRLRAKCVDGVDSLAPRARSKRAVSAAWFTVPCGNVCRKPRAPRSAAAQGTRSGPRPGWGGSRDAFASDAGLSIQRVADASGRQPQPPQRDRAGHPRDGSLPVARRIGRCARGGPVDTALSEHRADRARSHPGTDRRGAAADRPSALAPPDGGPGLQTGPRADRRRVSRSAACPGHRN